MVSELVWRGEAVMSDGCSEVGGGEKTVFFLKFRPVGIGLWIDTKPVRSTVDPIAIGKVGRGYKCHFF